MKRFFTTLLVSILIVLPLTGCAEEVIPPTGNGDFGITIDQLIQGLEEDRLSRVEIYEGISDFDEGKKSLDFKKKEIDGIQKYTAKNAGITIEAFCQNEKVYCVKLWGNAERKSMDFEDPNIKVYGDNLMYWLVRDIHTPQSALPDRLDPTEEWYMFSLSDGEVKELEGNGVFYHAEKKKDTLTAIFTPSETREELGLNR